MSKPIVAQINAHLSKLRAFIEDSGNDPLERRLAQIAEDSIRWTREEADWPEPVDELSTMATIIRNEIKLGRIKCDTQS